MFMSHIESRRKRDMEVDARVRVEYDVRLEVTVANTIMPATLRERVEVFAQTKRMTVDEALWYLSSVGLDATAMWSRAGRARADKQTPEQRRAQARKAIETRWARARGHA